MSSNCKNFRKELFHKTMRAKNQFTDDRIFLERLNQTSDSMISYANSQLESSKHDLNVALQFNEIV